MTISHLTIALVLAVAGTVTITGTVNGFWVGVLLLGMAALYLAKSIVEWRDR